MNKQKSIYEMKIATVGIITDELFNKTYFNWHTDFIYFGDEMLEMSDSQGNVYLIRYEDILSIDGVK